MWLYLNEKQTRGRKYREYQSAESAKSAKIRVLLFRLSAAPRYVIR
jgi:hypothetical protein